MDIPESMQEELRAWNNGEGIDLESWVGCTGSYSLAVAYTEVFWPEFLQHRGYVLRAGFSEESLRGFERQAGATRRSVEWVMNHLHIADIHYSGCPDLTRDKVVILGTVLVQIYRAKLQAQFPALNCTVEFYEPPDPENLIEYQVSFWQDGGDDIPVTPPATMP